MASKKDLVEAHAFGRRRLVSAFLSGAPGGREVEPPRPGRTILGGVALGVLVLAGGAIAGVFVDRPPEGWLDPGLVAGGGSLYAITEEADDPELRPIDPVSARLVFGTDEDIAEVSAEDLAERRIGDELGIFGAPAALPAPDSLVDRGWTACSTDGGGTRLDVQREPAATPAPGAGLVVRTEDSSERWLVAYGAVDGDPDPQTLRYLLPTGGGRADALLGDLGLPQALSDAAVVDQDWLELLPDGVPLTADGLDVGPDGPVTGSAAWFGTGDDLAAGDLVTSGDRVYLVTADGPTALDEVAEAVHRADAEGYAEVDGGPLATDSVGGVAPDGWPTAAPTAVGDGSLCLVLEPREDASPTVLLTDAPDVVADPVDVGAGEVQREVGTGLGAHVRAGGFDAEPGTSSYVVDASGTRYLLEGDEAAGDLGYGAHDPPTVPETWLELLPCGPVLSRDAALAPPDPDAAPSC